MKAAYLIHFDQPFSHAMHYAGATNDLQARLIRHASGQGARLIAAVMESGIAWQCIAAWKPAWKCERYLKDMNNSPRYCPLCRKKPRGIPGALYFDADDLRGLGIILDSVTLATKTAAEPMADDCPF